VNQKQGLHGFCFNGPNIPHKFVFMKNTGHAPRFFSKRKETALFILIFWNGLEDNLFLTKEESLIINLRDFFIADSQFCYIQNDSL
jgi:hypothetical protein